MSDFPIAAALQEEVSKLTTCVSERTTIGYHLNVYMSLHGVAELLRQIERLGSLYPNLPKEKILAMHSNLKNKIQETYANIQL